MMTPESVVTHFALEAPVTEVRPLGAGLINDTYLVVTEGQAPDYVLQRVNHAVFTDVPLLQHNIEAVTSHIRRKLEAAGTPDVDRRVLTPVMTTDGTASYYYDGEKYWRMMRFIPDTLTVNEVNEHTSRDAGRMFGQFQAMLIDIDESLGETIPDFHNMEFRLQQLRQAISEDRAGRLDSVRDIADALLARADEMCMAERLHREGKLPKRICHCDTKVNNMLFDRDGQPLCVIDLDTVMPSFVFSDFGDFMRTAASTLPEDDPAIGNVRFRMPVFKAFAEGYLEGAGSFLTDVEIVNLPYAVALFPYMQAVRFFADYLNGDTYYKIAYPEHNLVRTRNQMALLADIDRHSSEMAQFINQLRHG